MAPDIERSIKNTVKSKLLTMDVIELTLLLKSIGFRLESIDYDEFRSWGKKSNDCGNGNSSIASSTTTPYSVRSDVEQHFINVEISCSKSKIVSNLSFKFNECDTVASDTMANSLTDSVKLMTCTCPKREPRNDNSSFWEVQSSGTFQSNQRRSINALLNSEAGIDHDTSSNLLPSLSTKSIALTHVLTQVLLNQYKNNSQFGESNAKDVDIKSIMRAVSMMDSEKVTRLPSVSQVEDLNLITPLSSMNVTPNEDEGLMNVTVPKVIINTRNSDEFTGKTTALNDTVNTETFTSPKNDLFTSSPHTSNISVHGYDRDSNVINLLDRARHSIDQALISMKLNVTRNLSQEILTPLSTTTKDIQYDKNHNRSNATQPIRILNERNASQVTSNVRPPLSTLNRRASIGSTAGKTVPPTSAAITSRLNVTKPNSIIRPMSTNSAAGGVPKVALVRRTVSSIANRTIGGITGLAKTPTIQQTNVVKRISSATRRTSSPATLSNGMAPINGSVTRKTVATTKLTPLPSKLVKK